MTTDTNPLMAPFLAAAVEIAPTRPEVDTGTICEIFVEAATMLHDGLALDGLDEHDTAAVVGGLCAALTTGDPGAAIRAASRAAVEHPGDLHDPKAVSVSYLIAAGILQV